MWVMVDIEADGPAPGIFSMIDLGAVIVEKDLKHTFRAFLKPISDKWVPNALAVSGFSRDEVMLFADADIGIRSFNAWLNRQLYRKNMQSPKFISDNNGFDWQFINYYFHRYQGRNPFGFSSQNQGSLYKGCVQDMKASFKKLRKTRHTHNPVDDAMGNAEALLTMNTAFELGFKFQGKNES